MNPPVGFRHWLTRLAVVSLLIAIGVMSVWILRTLRCPLKVTVVSVEPSGMVDAAGVEALYVTLELWNQSDTRLWLSRDDKRIEARRTEDWQVVESSYSINSHLFGRQRDQLAFAVPGRSRACRLVAQYQVEPFSKALWRKLGAVGQRRLGKLIPNSTVKWLSTSSPPSANGYRPVTLELPLPAQATEARQLARAAQSRP